MQPLTGKTIILGVTGGIAAYKAAALTSKLTQAGAAVYVMMTENATRFVQPLTFQALSHLPVYTDVFQEPDPRVISHIDLADRADLAIIAPATANVIGKLAHGLADDMLTTTLLATKAPVMIAPAMNVNMYGHPAVLANMEKLTSYGYRFIEPGEGLLACGWVGKGRLAEPEEIVAVVQRFFAEPVATHDEKLDLAGQRVLITAGPTREKIDPVRYISNHSSGKMGYALAEAARDRGAEVVLVSGPTALARPRGVTFIPVESVQEMHDAVLGRFADSDIVIKAAAVSDYRPVASHAHKLKKTEGPFHLEMERAPDILQTIGQQKTTQYLVGFAAETRDVSKYAREKLVRKNADMIVANDVLAEGAGMGTDTNIVTLVTKEDELTLPIMSKREVADRIFDAILQQRSHSVVDESK